MTALAETGAIAETDASTAAGGFEKILDSALNKLLEGQNIDNICGQYPPDCANQLKPFLLTAQTVREAEHPTPDLEAKKAGRNRLLNQIGQIGQKAKSVS